MRLVAGIAAATFAVDQLSKLLVVHRFDLMHRGEIEVLPPYLTFRMAWNTGINFGLLSGGVEIMRWVLILVALGISVWVWRWVHAQKAEPRMRIAAGLLIGGALGNVVDRVIYGAVADFLNMSCCGIENPFAFNVADVAIFAGAAGLILFGGNGAAPGQGRRKTP